MTGRNWTSLFVLVACALPAGAVFANPLEPDLPKPDEERLSAGLYPSAPGEVPPEPAQPPFDIDWSIGLRGSYTDSSTSDGRFTTTLNPAFTATHDGRRLDVTIDGEAEIARAWDGSADLQVQSLTLGAAGEMLLDRETTLTGTAGFRLSQDLPDAPGVDPVVIVPPQVLNGSAGLGIERRMGKLNLSLTGDVARTTYGASTRADTGTTDNTDQNLWAADASLRAGFQVTPIFEVFGIAAVGRDMFDAPSPSLGVRTDATTRSLRGGISGDWRGVVTASASAGIGYHDFDAAGLTDITTQLYDASITFTPDPTLRLRAGLSTDIEPTGADASGTARVTHLATANVDYIVNSWLRLRASADWGLSTLEGSDETERRHGFGLGADYRFNSRAALAADYSFAHRDNSRTGLVDSHTVSVGVTLQR